MTADLGYFAPMSHADEPTCAGKVRYNDKDEADAAMTDDPFGWAMESRYHDYCNGWHIRMKSGHHLHFLYEVPERHYPRYRVRYRRGLWVVDLVASREIDQDRDRDGLILGVSIRQDDAIKEARAKLGLTR